MESLHWHVNSGHCDTWTSARVAEVRVELVQNVQFQTGSGVLSGKQHSPHCNALCIFESCLLHWAFVRANIWVSEVEGGGARSAHEVNKQIPATQSSICALWQWKSSGKCWKVKSLASVWLSGFPHTILFSLLHVWYRIFFNLWSLKERLKKYCLFF